MPVSTRTPTFTPPGQFSWPKAAATSLGVHAAAIAVLAIVVVPSGLGVVKSDSDSVVSPGYALFAWAALQGVYPLYHRASGAPDDHIPQSPRSLRLLAEHIDLERETSVWSTYGISGLVVYAAVLLWFARSVRKEPLGPPPAKRTVYGAAVASR